MSRRKGENGELEGFADSLGTAVATLCFASLERHQQRRFSEGEPTAPVLLQGLGYSLVRVPAAGVMPEIDIVLSAIQQLVERPHRSKRP